MIGALVAGQVGSGGASLSSYESIATATGTGSSGTITFSSIPSTFKHLQIRGIGRSSGSSVLGQMRFNLDTGANYTNHNLNGDGATAAVQGFTGETHINFARPTVSVSLADTLGATIVDILDYGNTSKYKTARMLMGNNNNDTSTTYKIMVGSGLWLNTNAITQIDLIANAGNWTTQTTFALYGIKEA